MENLGIGKIITTDQQRDAVHIAVAPVTAQERLHPGQRVDAAGRTLGKRVGVVDPFLDRCVMPGDRFWVFLFPGSVTSLRHEWTHPEFQPPEVKAEQKRLSEKWLRDFSGEVGCSYTALMNAVPTWRYHQDEANGERVEGVEGFDIPAEFWTHYEAVTGRAAGGKAAYFSCSCS